MSLRLRALNVRQQIKTNTSAASYHSDVEAYWPITNRVGLLSDTMRRSPISRCHAATYRHRPIGLAVLHQVRDQLAGCKRQLVCW